MTQVVLGLENPRNDEDNNFMPGINDQMLLRQLGFEVEDDESDFFFNGMIPPVQNPVRKRARNSPLAAERTVESVNLPHRHNSNRSLPVIRATRSPVSVIDISSDSESEDDYLPRVLELFPDISHEYVEELSTRFKFHKGMSYQERIVEEILANPSYPKQKELKRKRAASDEDQEWESGPVHYGDIVYHSIAARILAQEFPHVPTQYIRQILNDKQKLYSAYLFLYKHESTLAGVSAPYERLKRGRKTRPLEPDLETSRSNSLTRELNAAKKKAEKETALVRKRKEEEEAERLNEEHHTQAGTLVECQCCYLDVPSNRSISCDGMDVHFFCFMCIRKSAETQIGMMKYQLQCMDTGGCQEPFSRSQLREALGKSVMEKLDTLQQQDEITRAGLDGLESCPYCDFKAICPPVEQDREFRCCNPTCEIISCRLCHEESHIPQTCEEAKKERGVSERHHVEEAMSEALIRTCPRCKVKIVKEAGCNKMTCAQCRCMMCYVCKKDISREQYAHFGRGPNSCRVDDDPRQNRYQQEVEQAEQRAIDKIRAENPSLTREELQVHIEDKKANATRHAHNIRPPFIPDMAFGVLPQRPHRPPQYAGRLPQMPQIQLPAYHHYPHPAPLFQPLQPEAQGMPNLHRTRAPRPRAVDLYAAAGDPLLPPNNALQELANQIETRRRHDNRHNVNATINDINQDQPAGPTGLLANAGRPTTAANISAATTQQGVTSNTRHFANTNNHHQNGMTAYPRRQVAPDPYPAERTIPPAFSYPIPRRRIDVPQFNFADEFFGERRRL